MNLLNILLQAAAPAQGQGGMGGYSGILMMVLIFVVFYFFMIRPEKKRKKKIFLSFVMTRAVTVSPLVHKALIRLNNWGKMLLICSII